MSQSDNNDSTSIDTGQKPIHNPLDHLPSSRHRDVPRDTYLISIRACKSIRDSPGQKHRPSVVAAAALYISDLINEHSSDPLTQSEAADLCGTTAKSLRNAIRATAQHLQLMIDLSDFDVDHETVRGLAVGQNRETIRQGD